MHIPDGFIDMPTSIAAVAIAGAGVGTCLRRTRTSMSDEQIPIVGLTAAFVFAGQMVNFPVAAGTSGHLLGGVLAAVLVGPWAGALAVTVVLTVQALLFADGGVSAWGLNVVNMALVGALLGYALLALVRPIVTTSNRGIAVGAGVAAALAPMLGALAFTLEYAIGGNGAASVQHVLVAMLSVHALIGVGEGVITAMVLTAVLATRPDLVHLASSRVAARPLEPVGGTS